MTTKNLFVQLISSHSCSQYIPLCPRCERIRLHSKEKLVEKKRNFGGCHRSKINGQRLAYRERSGEWRKQSAILVLSAALSTDGTDSTLRRESKTGFSGGFCLVVSFTMSCCAAWNCSRRACLAQRSKGITFHRWAFCYWVWPKPVRHLTLFADGLK